MTKAATVKAVAAFSLLFEYSLLVIVCVPQRSFDRMHYSWHVTRKEIARLPFSVTVLILRWLYLERYVLFSFIVAVPPHNHFCASTGPELGQWLIRVTHVVPFILLLLFLVWNSGTIPEPL